MLLPWAIIGSISLTTCICKNRVEWHRGLKQSFNLSSHQHDLSKFSLGICVLGISIIPAFLSLSPFAEAVGMEITFSRLTQKGLCVSFGVQDWERGERRE
jgi:hypothetical protein